MDQRISRSRVARVGIAGAAALIVLACAGLAAASGAAKESSSAHFILRGNRVLTVDTRTLASRDTPDSTLYEISGGQLHITPSDQPRYLYGSVRELEPRLLAAERFTIFISADSASVTLVHANETRIKITSTTVLSRGP